MTKSEFEKRIKEFNLKKVYREDEITNVFGRKKELYIDKITNDLYGCAFDETRKLYIIFFIDLERDIARGIGKSQTEDEAYERLFYKIKKWSTK